MKLLLHICCAPCSTATVESWRSKAAGPAGWQDAEPADRRASELAGVYFNPNIHPYAEHERRYEAVLGYAGRIGLSLIGQPKYDMADWLRQVHGKEEKGSRCRICIGGRLRHTAELAAAGGFDAFSTTLSISPYQDHDIIREEGRRAAAAHGPEFLYRDLRPLYRRSRELSRDAGLYRQKYCGCIFSEAEAEMERSRAREAKRRAREAEKRGREEQARARKAGS